MKTPDHDFLHERGRAMEDAFFAQRDRQLLDRLRLRLSAQEAEELLQSATGVSEKIALKELSDLSAPEFLAVLGLYPLVAIAWCDRRMEANERGAVVAAARDMGLSPASPSHELLEKWLEQPPAPQAMQLWTAYVQAVCKTLQPQTIQALRNSVMTRARKVAEAAGGFLGLGHRVSEQEQACLDQLARAFDEPAA
jgi:hypothetical protein